MPPYRTASLALPISTESTRPRPTLPHRIPISCHPPPPCASPPARAPLRKPSPHAPAARRRPRPARCILHRPPAPHRISSAPQRPSLLTYSDPRAPTAPSGRSTPLAAELSTPLISPRSRPIRPAEDPSSLGPSRRQYPLSASRQRLSPPT
ncbi:hypothetical protein BD309DRAFT_529231 [Dichomitus squalens]|nr:hypothetical protein BD309DRAFT_529231 [Dichomitus squalens]